MGVLCEIYIADEKRALMYCFHGECKCKDPLKCKCWDAYSFTTYDHVESHRVYVTEFAPLLSILRGKKYTDSVLKQFKYLKGSYYSEGPWIQKVPEDFPTLLAAKKSKELKVIAERWCKNCWDNDSDDSVELAHNYLKLVHKLSKKSVKKEQAMYLWTCL